MSFKLDDVVPWGRNFTEYCDMFALSGEDLASTIIGCGDGPASFNCEGRRQGYQITSVDPLYQFSALEIRQRINLTCEKIMEQAHYNRHLFSWITIKNIADLRRIRMQAMELFLQDFTSSPENYIAAKLPQLPFAAQSFDLALCSHFLFLYSETLSRKFHFTALAELLRVAQRVRVFPLLDFSGTPSPHLDIVDEFTRLGYKHRFIRVNYEFQRDGHTMLEILR